MGQIKAKKVIELIGYKIEVKLKEVLVRNGYSTIKAFARII